MSARPAAATRVMYDGLYTFVMRILNAVCAAGLGILTARMLGPAGKGLYALPGVEAGLVVSAFSGVGSALSYFLLNRKLSRSILIPACTTALLFVIAGGAALIPIALFSGQRWALVPALASLPAAACVNLAAGYAIGVKRVRYSTTVNVAVTVLTLALMACGFFFIQRSPAVAIVVWIAASTLVGILAIGAVVIHARRLGGSESVSTAEFAKFGVKVGFVNLVSLLNYRADLYIVALLTSPAALGMYTVAVSAAESLLVPTQVTALVTSPHIGSLERNQAAALTARCVRNNVLIALVVCGALFAFAQPLVHLLYGAAFFPTVGALQILLVGVFALSLGSPMSSYFTLKLGRPEVPLSLAAVSALICIATSLALVPRMGFYGAAIGSSVAYIVAQAGAIGYFAHTTSVSLREILLPTWEDLALYRTFTVRLLRDIRPHYPGRGSIPNSSAPTPRR
ncbi:MAG TPA: polysaccharide biosynthesis C-terminal domain-containing protein [Candidatus Baltobacteraceae bacterium]|nr:polysaccharide biosynthesis C-terminal domain-containing protein [Candidatus Baltobacteraceae bacterium]